MRIWACILTTLAFAATAAAQPNRADFDLPAIDPDPLYHIELILFAFDEGNRFEEDFLHGLDNPQFLPAPRLLHVPVIEMESAVRARLAGEPGLPEIDRPATDSPIPGFDSQQDRLEPIELGQRQDFGSVLDSGSVPAGFRPLTAGELQLNDAAARMNRRPYSLLGHVGWVQTGVDTDRSVQLDLKRLGITNPTGTIEIYVRRFLHALVDIDFHDGNQSFWTAAGGLGVMPFQYAQSYRIEREVNAIRSGDPPHYIDHPLFGVLIQITRAPEADDETGTDNAGGPAG